MKKGLIVVTVFLLVVSMIPVKSYAGDNKLESWYAYWGLGYADIKYPTELDNLLTWVEKQPGVSHLSLCFDGLGFYFPRGPRTITGFVINTWGDRYEINNESMQLNGYLFSLSFMHFLNHRIGRGFFIRGDAGAAKFSIVSDGLGSSSSDWGWGGLVGGGFGIPITPGTRLLFNINYSIRHVEGESVGALEISVGGLF